MSNENQLRPLETYVGEDGRIYPERRYIERRCPIAGCVEPQVAADRAVKRVFEIMGVDVDKPEQVNQFRKGINFGQDLQKFANRGLMTIVIVVCTLGVGALFLGIAYKIKVVLGIE
jgi:hypothetical protein